MCYVCDKGTLQRFSGVISCRKLCTLCRGVSSEFLESSGRKEFRDIHV